MQRSAKPDSHVQYASHLYQCSGFGKPRRRDLELVDPVEAAAVDLPRLAADALVAVHFPLGLAQVVVERDEVERGADPDDRRGGVEPAEDEVEPVGGVRG